MTSQAASYCHLRRNMSGGLLRVPTQGAALNSSLITRIKAHPPRLGVALLFGTNNWIPSLNACNSNPALLLRVSEASKLFSGVILDVETLCVYKVI
jgi:hypothetical protein